MAGYLSVISGATSTVSEVVSKLTFDSKYSQMRANMLRESKRSAPDAAKNAVKSFGVGIAEGFAGIIM